MMKQSALILILFLLLFIYTGAAHAANGIKKKRPLPADYGKVVLNNNSDTAHIAPVVFDHWLHRSKFTCRLCHVDIGFGMKAGSTGIKASDNSSGYYCGACHADKKIAGTKVFKACPDKVRPPYNQNGCERCHSYGKTGVRRYDFSKFSEGLPRERFGNGINWEQAEAEGYIHLTDFLDDVSIKRAALPNQQDFALKPKVDGMPATIFSHKKHTVWNGCELCHPEIFVGVKKGITKYSMTEIYEGKFCGVCHNSVAFPVTDCQRCHTQPASASKAP